MENFRIQARMAERLCREEGKPYPLPNDGLTFLLETGATIFKSHGKYFLGSYHFAGQDTRPYLLKIESWYEELIQKHEKRLGVV